ncbi:hypothetical protein CCYA_CCYA15G3906 [Cyanidiococcus yangmingshanensis]|nr:hypothetical protein CCYA_CCYA15G3906 [Cyanidiococcus yangmingshanensis]
MKNLKRSTIRGQKRHRATLPCGTRLSTYLATLARALAVDPEPRALSWSADGEQILVLDQARFMKRYLNSKDWFPLSSWSSFLRIMTDLHFRRQPQAGDHVIRLTHPHWSRPLLMQALEAQEHCVELAPVDGDKNCEATNSHTKRARKSSQEKCRSDGSEEDDMRSQKTVGDLLDYLAPTSPSIPDIEVDQASTLSKTGKDLSYSRLRTTGRASDSGQERDHSGWDPAGGASRCILEDLLNDSEHSSIESGDAAACAVLKVQEGGRAVMSNGVPRGTDFNHRALAALVQESVEEALHRWSSKVELYVVDELRILSEKLSQLLIAIEKVDCGHNRIMHQLESMRLLGVEMQMLLRQLFHGTMGPLASQRGVS